MSKDICRAKDKARCWKHGNQQGIVANEQLQKLLADPKATKYYLSAEQRLEMPLKKLNTSGLALTILDEIKDDDTIDSELIKQAILMASDLHRRHKRSNRGRYDKTPYIEHPLRNALRAIRYGAKTETVIIGSLLHDTVEDNPFEIYSKYSEAGAGSKTDDEALARQESFKYINSTFGNATMKMVEGMSNPLPDSAEPIPVHEKNAIYAAHVKEAIEDPNVCVGKVCDFVDNATGLHHNVIGNMSTDSIRRRAVKYLPVCDIIEARLNRAKQDKDLPVTGEGLEAMIKHIKETRKSLLKLSIAKTED